MSVVYNIYTTDFLAYISIITYFKEDNLKKFLLYFNILLIICFCLPLIFVKKFEIKETSAEDEKNDINIENKDNENEDKYKYNKYGTIKLLHNDTGEVEEVEIDKYLYGVVSAEMPANYHINALKAQAVVARTYTIYKILNSKHENADICDDSTCCQAWISKSDRFAKWEENMREENWSKIANSVDSTAGSIIVYNNSIINAFFHSNSGGKTEIPLNVWGGSDYPYLQVVETLGEDEYTQYSSEVVMSKEEFKNKILSNYADFQINFNDANAIEVLELTDGGRVKNIKFGNVQMTGVEARNLFGLRSARFSVKLESENIVFSVIGYGHGVGMSQTGADYLAKNGYTYDSIIKHFYSGVEIIDLNSY